MGREYSFEVYAPETDDGAGRRLDYEDHYGSVRDATAAMLESIRYAPEGGTAIVYQRSSGGDMLLPRRNWIVRDGKPQRAGK